MPRREQIILPPLSDISLHWKGEEMGGEKRTVTEAQYPRFMKISVCAHDVLYLHIPQPLPPPYR